MIIPQKPPDKNCNQYLQLRIFLYITVVVALYTCNYVYNQYHNYGARSRDTTLSNNVPALSKITVSKGRQIEFNTWHSFRFILQEGFPNPDFMPFSVWSGDQPLLKLWSGLNSNTTYNRLRSDRDPFMPIYEDENNLSVTDGGFFIRPIPKEDNVCEDPHGLNNINLSVTGIILSKKGYNAIIKDETGKSYIVSPGEEIRGWKISFITGRNVFLLKWNFVTILNLENSEGIKNKKPPGRLQTITL